MKYLGVFAVVMTAIAHAQLPAEFPRCHNGDTDCYVKAANEVLRKFPNGLREADLPPFEPLHVKSIVLERNPSSPVNVELIFTDADFIGIKNMEFTKITGLRADLSGRSSFEGIIPDLLIKGNYKIDGRVLLLPIVGNGPFEINIKNVKINYSFDLKPFERDGQTFSTLEHTKMDMTIEHMTFHLHNLFNGNKELGDHMNLFLNENWQDIYEELRLPFTKAISLIVKSIANRFHEKSPYVEHFL